MCHNASMRSGCQAIYRVLQPIIQIKLICNIIIRYQFPNMIVINNFPAVPNFRTERRQPNKKQILIITVFVFR